MCSIFKTIIFSRIFHSLNVCGGETEKENFTPLSDEPCSCKWNTLLFIHKMHWMDNCWKMWRTNAKSNLDESDHTWMLILIYLFAHSGIVVDFQCVGKKNSNWLALARRKAQSKHCTCPWWSAEAKIKYLYVKNWTHFCLSFISHGLNYALYPKSCLI